MDVPADALDSSNSQPACDQENTPPVLDSRETARQKEDITSCQGEESTPRDPTLQGPLSSIIHQRIGSRNRMRMLP